MMNGNPFAAHLEALDQKAGHIHTMGDWQRVGEISQHQPQALTDDDLLILAYFGGEKTASRDRARRMQARNPPPPAPATKAAPLPAAQAGNSNDRANVRADTADSDDGLTWKEYVAKHGHEWITLALAAALVDQVDDVWKQQWNKMNEKNVERNARHDAAEARLKALEEQKTLKDGGIWRHGSQYIPGDVVQFRGSPWVCIKWHTASGTPDHSCWRLLLKSYQTSKDVRP